MAINSAVDKNVFKCPQCQSETTDVFCGSCGFKIFPGVESRFAANLIDGIIIDLFDFLIHQIPSAVPVIKTGFGSLIWGVYLLGFVVAVKLWGQTPGKVFVRIKIVRLDGKELLWKNVLLRYSPGLILLLARFLLALVDAQSIVGFIGLAYVIASIVLLFKDKKHRMIHDLIAGTVVVREPQKPKSE